MYQSKDTKEFIEKSKPIHANLFGSLYKYRCTKYNDLYEDVDIECVIHGIFKVTPWNHYMGKGCPKCLRATYKSTAKSTEDVIDDFKAKHGDLFIYDKVVDYINSKTHVMIGCRVPGHGYFPQTPKNHLNGISCPMCSKTKKNDDFIEKAIERHGDKYGYKLSNYVNADTKVTITCGDHTFEQTPDNHLRGKGCPKCITSKGEDKILKYLKDNNIIHKQEHKFKDCRNKQPLPFDFYIPHLNTCIEFDGIQHFQPVARFGGEKAFQNRIANDNIKSTYCADKNINLIRIRYDQISQTNEILNESLLPIVI